MYHSKKLDNLNILVETVIKFKNNFYKLAIEIYYNKVNSKVKPYFRYINYCSR